MVIDEHDFDVANAAIRDILFLFRDLIVSYDGFEHGVDAGQFDPFAYSEVDIQEPDGSSLGIDTNLLVTGSAVALISAISDTWDEFEPEFAVSCDYFKRVKDTLDNGGFEDFPDLRKVLKLGLFDEDAFRALLPAVFDKYVSGYFRSLIGVK